MGKIDGFRPESLSVDAEHAVGLGRVGAVFGEVVAGVVGHKATLVEAVLAVAVGAGGCALAVYAERVGTHGQRVEVKAVGTFTVVGVEDGWVFHIAVSHDEAAVHADVLLHLHPVVDGVEDAGTGETLAVAERVVLGAALEGEADDAERAGIVGVHRRGEHGVEVLAVVDGQIAVVAAKTVALVATGHKGNRHHDCYYIIMYMLHPSRSNRSASATRSKWKPLSVSSMSWVIRSLQRLPIEPSWVWCMLRSALKVPASISSPTFL